MLRTLTLWEQVSEQRIWDQRRPYLKEMKGKTGLWVSPRHFGGLPQSHWEVIHWSQCQAWSASKWSDDWVYEVNLSGRMVRPVEKEPAVEAKKRKAQARLHF